MMGVGVHVCIIYIQHTGVSIWANCKSPFVYNNVEIDLQYGVARFFHSEVIQNFEI